MLFKKIKAWTNSQVIIKNPSIHGRGLFAKEPIKGEAVLRYGGYEAGSIISWISHVLVGDYGWQISKNRFLVPFSQKDLESALIINHSCDPNLGLKDERALVALRNIEKGEELVLDYAMVTTNEPFAFLKFLFPYQFNCACGSKNCRKVITGEDWKSKELQDKYDKYFSPYIQRKFINKSN